MKKPTDIMQITNEAKKEISTKSKIDEIILEKAKALRLEKERSTSNQVSQNIEEIDNKDNKGIKDCYKDCYKDSNQEKLLNQENKEKIIKIEEITNTEYSNKPIKDSETIEIKKPTKLESNIINTFNLEKITQQNKFEKIGKVDSFEKFSISNSQFDDFEIISNKSNHDDYIILEKVKEDVFTEDDWNKLINDNTTSYSGIYAKLSKSLKYGIPDHMYISNY